MTHILDNPIWNALSTGNNDLAFGTERAMYLKRDVGFFVGLKTNSESEFRDLYTLLPAESLAVLFTPDNIFIPQGWSLEMQKPILQMVYHQDNPFSTDKSLT